METEFINFFLKYLDPNFFSKAFSYCLWYWIFFTVILVVTLRGRK
jgi:hypothetical protein